MATFMKNITLVSHSASLFRDEKLKSAGITGCQARYILAVCNDEGISQDKLAKNLFVNKSNVARQMSALEEAGYIRRVQSGEDKRVALVYPTEKARGIYPLIRAINAEWREVVCEGLTDAEKQTLSELVEKLVVNARRYTEKNNEKDA